MGNNGNKQRRGTGSILGRFDPAALVVILIGTLVAFAAGLYVALDEEGISPGEALDFFKGGRTARTGVSGSQKTDNSSVISQKIEQPPVSQPVENVPPEPVEENKPDDQAAPQPEPEQVDSAKEEIPQKDITGQRPTKPEEPRVEFTHPEIKGSGSGEVAIIIDDFGNNMNNVEEFCSMDVPVTFAVLPYLAHSKKISRMAVDSGKSVILHLPMENQAGINPGPGTLRTEMKTDELVKEFKMDLSFVPGAEGFNNHEGSKFTEDEEGMREVMKQAKEKGLFFVDSLTSSRSRGLKTAEEEGVPALKRNVFLDNEDDVQYISGQLAILAEKALAEGYAVGIGHVRRNTYLALKEMAPVMEEKGIKFVFVRDLVR